MQAISKRASAGLVLLLLLLFVVGILWILAEAPQPLSTIAAAAIGFVATKIYEAWNEGKSRLHEKKREVYQQLLDPYFRLTLSAITKEDAATLGATLGPDMVKATFQGIMFASDDVLRRLNEIRFEALKTDVSGVRLLVHLSRLLKAVRKDLGHSFTSLSDIEILALFVNMTAEDIAKFQSATLQTPPN